VHACTYLRTYNHIPLILNKTSPTYEEILYSSMVFWGCLTKGDGTIHNSLSLCIYIYKHPSQLIPLSKWVISHLWIKSTHPQFHLDTGPASYEPSYRSLAASSVSHQLICEVKEAFRGHNGKWEESILRLYSLKWCFTP
jgi:hypothetical protein